MRAVWNDRADEDTAIFYHEIDPEDNELRRVEVYDDGHLEWGSVNEPHGSAELTWITMPSVEDVNNDSETGCTATEINKDEFERMWRIATQPNTPL